jgi:hypothetical protein
MSTFSATSIPSDCVEYGKRVMFMTMVCHSKKWRFKALSSTTSEPVNASRTTVQGLNLHHLSPIYLGIAYDLRIRKEIGIKEKR